MSVDARQIDEKPWLTSESTWFSRVRLGIKSIIAGEQGRAWLVVALIACVMTVVSVAFLTIIKPADQGPDHERIVSLLYVMAALTVFLSAIIGRWIWRMVRARRQGVAGSRLHLRFVLTFCTIALAPALVVSAFSLAFLNYSLQSWFGETFKKALTDSSSVAVDYLEDHKDLIGGDALGMARELQRQVSDVGMSQSRFQRLVDELAVERSLIEAIVFQRNGDIWARTRLSFLMQPETLPDDAFSRAERGVHVIASESYDRVRALTRLQGPLDVYLYVGRSVDPKILDYVDSTKRAVNNFAEIEASRTEIQQAFSLLYWLVGLLLFLLAIWSALNFAEWLLTPVSHLISAAGYVSQGHLDARVPVDHRTDELATLSDAFNRMAQQLEQQRYDLIHANMAVDQRRRFTEAVLRDVSAGVIGIDGMGRLTFVNPSAEVFLDEAGQNILEKPVQDLVPEFVPLISRASSRPYRHTEQEIEINRDGHQRTLLVRVSGQGGEDGGYVITFDDLSDLLSAQRKAAWAEIARRIAHEIKNPLTPIQLSAERLKRKYLPKIDDNQEQFVRMTDTIIDQVENIGRLIDEFSGFARMPAPQFGLYSAQELIRQVMSFEEVARPQITFEASLPAQDYQLYCDDGQVSQALLNIIHNAGDSITESDMPDGEGVISASLQRSNTEIRIVISDNGPGFGRDTSELLRPYVTTRKEGTGLGLAIVRKIMEEHGGRIELANRAEGGANVSLIFPTKRTAQEQEQRRFTSENRRITGEPEL